ncbi:putative bifunctional diguanylate cyclase/phosphodiesterase [Sinisalibacter aestuarii]|uniref:Diguanylate cyclase n=1 Tax=Sinisalibacter aestuarii TaxID=2949426 RepID=A0ABQ5LW09_9RHOB|nr:bifunctional diguanylate cyclase/phosphodiesterase [Sinisalibacter aestuarii]GKY89179.1 diguanylate cyclase [Sinisalibacter aestuarii]
MGRATGSQIQSIWGRSRAALVGPQLAAFLPAIMLGAYWFGGEGVLLTTAVIVPALIAFFGLMARPGPMRTGRDAVTGLPGRVQLIRMLEPRRGAGDDPIALVIEIDNAHHLARQYGDEGFATVLRAGRDRLESVLREGDFVAALGAGRFGLALAQTPRVDLETMIQLAARLQEALAAPIPLGGARVLVTACIGFALPARVTEATGEALLAAAESALDEAQRSGPGSIRAFTRAMRPRVSAPDNVTREVVKALEAGQIQAWFQPQISTDTGALTGFEALARWDHPEKGMIAPGAFLPAIARAGMFERLGEVILFQSLTALRDWDRAGLQVPNVSVNVSSDELRNPKLYDKIRWELDRFELAPDRLTIEILEDVVARTDDDTTTRNIAALSKLGCRIDLDDFGTGHASIANIRRFDVNRIKIDRSFITHVDTDRDQQNMVAAILTMAERLELETLGEGVESHGEHAMLAQLGCGHVQGYSIARPMPVAETAAWIAAHQQKIARPPEIPRKTG